MLRLTVRIKLLFFFIVFLGLCFLNLYLGKISLSIKDIYHVFFDNSKNEMISRLILEYRLPKIATVILTGIALPMSGMLMQALFRNPLADPSIFGITSAAGLGVAFVIFFSTLFNIPFLMESPWFIILAAFAMAFLVMLLLSLVTIGVKESYTLIVVGFMIASFTGGLIGMMEYFSSSEKIKNYIVWSFGSFTGLGWDKVGIYALFVFVGLSLSFFSLKSLYANQLGEYYAQTMGVNIKKMRLLVLLSASLLTAVATAFTGPIVFVGLAIPHICRLIFKTSNPYHLFFYVMLVGSTSMLFFVLLAELFPLGALPINIITSLFGAPIVLSILLGQNKIT